MKKLLAILAVVVAASCQGPFTMYELAPREQTVVSEDQDIPETPQKPGPVGRDRRPDHNYHRDKE